jgi:DNA recombination protein RmuC
VANLWKLEKQNKHAHDIARRAGLLYDKFVGFLSSIDDISKALGKATDAHDKAVSQLSTGPGNLVGQVEKLKAMGIRTKKELPQTFAKELEEPLPESEQTNLPLS